MQNITGLEAISKISVILLNWNNSVDTIGCVRHIRENWKPQPGSIIVVDNHSKSDDLERLKSSGPEFQLIENESNRGFGGGTNDGIKAALESGCDSILLLNNDAQISQDDLALLYNALSSDQRIAAVGPVLFDGQELTSAGGRNIAGHRDTHMRIIEQIDKPYDVAYTPGTVVLMRASVLDDVGLLDERYFFSGEVADLCRRMQQQGYRCVIEPRSRATHDIERSSRLRSGLHEYYTLRNRFLFINKFYAKQGLIYYLLWIGYGLGRMGMSVLRGNPGRLRACWLGLQDGVLGRFGNQNMRVAGLE